MQSVQQNPAFSKQQEDFEKYFSRIVRSKSDNQMQEPDFSKVTYDKNGLAYLIVCLTFLYYILQFKFYFYLILKGFWLLELCS